MQRFFLLLILTAACLSPLSAQNDRIPAETIGGALTKSMQGELGLDKEQLARIGAINLEYAQAMARLRETGFSAANQESLIRDWESDLRGVFNAIQFRDFQRMKPARMDELRLAGLDYTTARLAQELALDEAQISAVEAISSEYRPQMEVVRSGGDPQRIKQRRLSGLNQAREDALREVLTAEQFAAYRQLNTETWEQRQD